MSEMSTITQAQQDTIASYVEDRHLPAGLGTEQEPCSVAAINLALTGELTGRIPDCMSEVIGKWIIIIQDAMPDEMRNSVEWKRLLPFAAGTGRDHEEERNAVLMEWTWGTVLPTLQPLADEQGYGGAWAAMCAQRNAAWVAEAGYWAAEAAWAARAGEAARAARAAGAARADQAKRAALVAETALVAEAARTAWAARVAGAGEAAEAARAGYWATVDPCKVLADLIATTETVVFTEKQMAAGKADFERTVDSWRDTGSLPEVFARSMRWKVAYVDSLAAELATLRAENERLRAAISNGD